MTLLEARKLGRELKVRVTIKSERVRPDILRLRDAVVVLADAVEQWGPQPCSQPDPNADSDAPTQ